MNNNFLQPLIFEEKKQIFIFIEYLKEISENEHINLANKIDSLNLSTIVIRCFKKENENICYTPSFLKYVNKEKITSLYLYIRIDYELLKKFINLKRLGIVFLDNEFFDINYFKNLRAINISGYDNNFNCVKINNNIDFLLFSKIKNKVFDFSLNLSNISKLMYIDYQLVILDKINIDNLKELKIENNKKVCINNNIRILKDIEILRLTNCDTSWLNHENMDKLVNLRELYLEKCDLKFLDSKAFKILSDLNVLVIDKCKNLQSVNCIGTLDKIVILDTKIEDNNTEALLNIENVHITHYNTYNNKIN